MFSPNGIRYVLFDLDGTLRHSRPLFNEAFYTYAFETGAGLTRSEEGLRKANRWLHYYWAQSPELLADIEKFGDMNEDFWANHTRLNLLAYDAPQELIEPLIPIVNQRMRTEYQPENVVPEDVRPTLKRLREAGFTLALLSNRTDPCDELLESMGIAEYFSCSMVAGEINAWKPEPDFFRHGLERVGAPAEESIYVGDNYYADILGAQHYGIGQVLIDPHHLYPEAECPVIRTISELPVVLVGH